MKVTFNILLLFAFQQFVSAQKSLEIKGRIFDNSTNEPIPYATIYVDGTTNGIRMGIIKDIHEWAKDSTYIIVSGQA